MINMDNNVIKQAYIDENGQYIIILMDNTKIIVTQDELLNAYFGLDSASKNSINLIKHYEFDEVSKKVKVTLADGGVIKINRNTLVDEYLELMSGLNKLNYNKNDISPVTCSFDKHGNQTIILSDDKKITITLDDLINEYTKKSRSE